MLLQKLMDLIIKWDNAVTRGQPDSTPGMRPLALLLHSCAAAAGLHPTPNINNTIPASRTLAIQMPFPTEEEKPEPLFTYLQRALEAEEN